MKPQVLATLQSHCFDALDRLLPLHTDVNVKQVIKSYFNDHHKLGSRDRRFVTNTVFGYFRWLGVVQARPLEESIYLIWVLDEMIENADVDHLFKNDADRAEMHRNLLDAQTVAEKLEMIRKSEQIHIDTTDLVPVCAQLTYRENLDKWIDHLQSRAPVTVWFRADMPAELRTTFLEEFEPIETGPDYSVLASESNLRRHPAYQEGWIEIQDLGSQMIVDVCGAEPGQSWWDCCAGGGGKSLRLADRMKNQGNVLASDVREYKMREIRERAKRMEIDIIQTKRIDMTAKLKPSRFDGVLIDAPCSGSGTWRRNPQMRWQKTERSILSTVSLQQRILHAAARHVNVGGVLVYATCSIFNEENEDVVNHFLGRNGHFILDPVTHPLTGEMTNGMVYSDPSNWNQDGMFAARMRRRT